jgi:hypothetical protein
MICIATDQTNGTPISGWSLADYWRIRRADAAIPVYWYYPLVLKLLHSIFSLTSWKRYCAKWELYFAIRVTYATFYDEG